MAENVEIVDEIIDIEGYTETEDEEEEVPPLLITREDWEKNLEAVRIRKEDMNRLVMDFLVFEGYLEAALKFQHESGTKQVDDFERFIDRVAVVKEAIESGNLEVAVENLNALNPEILKTNFLLNQLRLVEIIVNGTDTEALAFAKKELIPFLEQNKVLQKEVERTVGILYFKGSTTFPVMVRDLFGDSQRFKTAADVNAAIHASQTGQKCSRIEYLLKMLIWTQDEMDGKIQHPRMSFLPTGQLIVKNPPE